MTGEEAGNLLLVQLGEYGLGYFDTGRMNSLFLIGGTNLIDKKVQEFQRSNKITREMQCMINTVTGVTPTSSTIDLSATSVDVPDYYAFVKAKLTSPYLTRTISKFAEERRHDQFVDPFTEGTARHPRYIMEAAIMRGEPADFTEADLTYFIKAPVIDTADNSTELPYNDKLILAIIDYVKDIIAGAERDQFLNQVNNQLEAKNP